MQRKVEIVFRRKVRAVWLDHGMALVAQGIPWNEAKPHLVKQVSTENQGAETIRKVLEHVRRIWFDPPDNCLALRAGALTLFRRNDSSNTRLLLNWGMAIAAYPFVGSVAEAVGRLLKLQTDVRREDIQRRLREQYGDRDYVNRITRYVVSSFLDWEVIAETKKAGIYQFTRSLSPQSGHDLAWLAEAALISRSKAQMSFSELRNHPVLFPVALDKLTPSSLQSNPHLRIERQSLNQEVIFLDLHRLR